VTGAAEWAVPPTVLRLDPHEVHVWRVRLDVSRAELSELAGALRSDEHVRAARYRFPRDRVRYIAARGQLRMILGRYLRRDPARVRFAASPHGKPHLAAASGVAPLRFNLAHSDDLALIGVAWRRELGVDIEREHPDRVDVDVARRMFPHEDVHALEALPPALRQRAFFQLWTIREAYAKATGLGLADTDANAAAPPTTWFVRQLPIDAGYAAAVAVERGSVRVRCWEWTASAVPLPEAKTA
jgi:4'-phosphopantetheinyl transferase